MAVRFYLGAAVVFEGHHAHTLQSTTGADDEHARRLDRQFGADFLCGLIHFGLFSAWSLTITLHGDSSVGEWAFRDLLLAVLLWDVVWVLVRPGRFDGTLIYWAAINAMTAAVVSLWYVWLRNKGWTSTDAEIPPLVLLALISSVDIAGATMRTRLLIDVLYNACLVLQRLLGWAVPALAKQRDQR